MEKAWAPPQNKMMRFRWRHMALPLIFLLLSVCLAAYFYPRLPDEIAYHFQDGLPDRWLSRGATITWLLVPQFLLAGLSAAVVLGVTHGQYGRPAAACPRLCNAGHFQLQFVRGIPHAFMDIRRYCHGPRRYHPGSSLLPCHTADSGKEAIITIQHN